VRESMQVPKTKAGQFSFFFVMEFISSFILCASTRAQAKGSYLWTGLTSIGWMSQLFILQKLMIDDSAARTGSAGAGTVLGGCAGDLMSLWVTIHLFGDCLIQ
jgi:hypothetical protein